MSTNSLPLYGRKYLLEVLTPSADGSGGTDVLKVADSAFEPEALRIVFEVEQIAYQGAYWYANIDIYNPSQDTTTNLLQASKSIAPGMRVRLQAGYEGPNYGLIWEGPVFQPLFTRENVVDYRITLRCILSLIAAASGQPQPSSNYGPGASQTEVVLDLIAKMGLHKDYVSPKLSQKKLVRGMTWFGHPERELSLIAQDNNMLWWLGPNGVSIGSPNDPPISTDPVLVYTPTTGLVGSPVQTAQGVDFTVLLDSRLKVQLPFLSVKIDQTQISQYAVPYGSLEFLPLKNDSGVYVIGGVRHRGDSRGQPWHTEVTGYQTAQSALAWSGLANLNQ